MNDVEGKRGALWLQSGVFISSILLFVVMIEFQFMCVIGNRDSNKCRNTKDE